MLATIGQNEASNETRCTTRSQGTSPPLKPNLESENLPKGLVDRVARAYIYSSARASPEHALTAHIAPSSLPVEI